MSDPILDLFPSQAAGRFGRRQKRERGARLPVTIVSGFLGAGKTTLVRKFLQTPEGRGTALIVNEFGSVGIDDALLRETTDEVTLLGNGCLCCNTRSDLQIALRRLVADRDRGKLPHFGRVLIETSGLADLSPILQTFSTDRALGGEFAIEVVLTLVDAVNGLRNLAKAPEARKQAILADRLVITKTDIAGAGATAMLSGQLRLLNPGVEPSKDGVQQLFRMYRAAFPDLRMQAEDVLVSGDKVVARVHVTGTHDGEFMGMAATGRRVDVQLIDITRFGEDGLAREHWGVFDALGMMQQLGAIPAPAPA